jgi:hypothetical protein
MQQRQAKQAAVRDEFLEKRTVRMEKTAPGAQARYFSLVLDVCEQHVARGIGAHGRSPVLTRTRAEALQIAANPL